VEHLAVIKTFSEGELLARLPSMNISCGGLFYSVEMESVEMELPSIEVGAFYRTVPAPDIVKPGRKE
jgi:hypothetical protein